MKIVIDHIQITCADDLTKVSTDSLLSYYNDATGKSTTKFASRAKGEAQVWKLVEPLLDKEPEQALPSVTELQAEFLKKMAFDLYQPTNGSEPHKFEDTSWIWSFVIETPEEKGVFTTLQQAGLAEHDGNTGEDAAVRLTPLGFKVFRAIQEGTAVITKSKAKAEPKAEKAPKAAPVSEKPKRQSKERGFRFKFQKQEQIKEVRPGSKRYDLLQLLKQEGGATFEECMVATGWNRKDCYEAIRLLHYYVGYGLDMNEETGKIWVVG